MKSFWKNLGVGVLLVGALLLIVPFFTHIQTNTTLLAGWLLTVAGFIAYIVINKHVK